MTWKPIARFDQVKPGDVVRFKERRDVQGTYRGDGHGLAIVHVTDQALKGAPRDVLCLLREIEVQRSEGDPWTSAK